MAGEVMASPRRDDKNNAQFDATVEQLHVLGLSQHRIAKELGVSRWQVRKAGDRLGLAWDDTSTADAVRASAAQARRDRVSLLLRWQDMAHHQLDAAETSHALDEQQRAVVMAGISTDKAVALAKLATVEPAMTEERAEEAGRSLQMLMNTVKQSTGYLELAKKLGATPDQLEHARYHDQIHADND